MDADFCADRSLKVPLGTDKYYADLESGSCLQDVDPADGGASSSDKLHADAATCCATLSWINSEYCESRSTGGTGSTNKWSVDYDTMTCKKDCPVDAVNAPECTPLDDKQAVLYDDAAACCSGKLGWLNAADCETVSMGGVVPEATAATPTNMYYADYSSNPPRCSRDCEVVDSDPGCGGVLASTVGMQLYNDTASCCDAKFSWMDSDLCQAKTVGASTGLWWVDYHSNTCKQDCPALENSPCGGSPPDLSMQLFEDPMECCTSKLGWTQVDACVSASATGMPAISTGTDKFYANYELGHCVKDCEVDPADPECTGILESTAGLQMFDDNAACCAGLFPWIDPDLCEVLPVGGHTDKYYVSYADNSCKKDCAVDAASPMCGGNPSDHSYDMYLDATACCEEQVNWQDLATCVTTSETGVAPVNEGTEKWYVDWGLVKCVKDCPVDAADPECGGLAESWELTNGGHDTAEDCCSTRLQWMNATTCHL